MPSKREYKRRLARAELSMRNNAEDADRYKELWLEAHHRLGELAKSHTPYFSVSGTHALDIPSAITSDRPQNFLWCKSCRAAWPCKTYIAACGGRKFRALGFEFISESEGGNE